MKGKKPLSLNKPNNKVNNQLKHNNPNDKQNQQKTLNNQKPVKIKKSSEYINKKVEENKRIGRKYGSKKDLVKNEVYYYIVV